MSFENVDIFIKDSLHEDPVSGVVVRVYSEDGATFFTQATSDVNGQASFLLATQNYQLRFYKQHIALPNPTYIEVIEAGPNIFDIPCDLVAPPASTDPRLCTAYGYFRRPDGSPAKNVDIHFIAQFKPLLLDGEAVVTERVLCRTDEKGYMEINLIRNGQYECTVQGIEDCQRCISVPDAPNVNLPDLLFPVVSRIDFDPEGPFTLDVGEEMQVTPTIYSSDGNVVDESTVQWSSSDQNVVLVKPAGGKLTLVGVAAGTAEVRAERADQSIVRIPNTPINGVPVAVTVT